MPTHLLPPELVPLANKINPEWNWIAYIEQGERYYLAKLTDVEYARHRSTQTDDVGFWRTGPIPNASIMLYVNIRIYPTCCGLDMGWALGNFPMNNPSLNTPAILWEWLQTGPLYNSTRPIFMVHYAAQGNPQFQYSWPAQMLAKYATPMETFRNSVHDHLLTTYLIYPERCKDYVTELKPSKLLIAPHTYRKAQP